GDEQLYPGGATLYRWTWQDRLQFGGVLLLLGAGFGALVGAAVDRGRLGASWRGEGVPFGAAVALPFMAAPLLYWGAPMGEVAAFGLAAAGSLPTARSLADRHPVERWPAALFGESVAIAITVAMTSLRAVDVAEPSTGVPLDRVLLLAGITLLPGAVVASLAGRTSEQRTETVLLGLGPGIAGLSLAFTFPNPAPAIAWFGVALGWRRLVGSSIIDGLRAMGRPKASVAAMPLAGPTDDPPEPTGWRFIGLRIRDLAALGLAAVAGVGVLLTCCDTWVLIIGLALGAAAGVALRRGLLGPAWREAAIPVACALAIPVFGAGMLQGGGGMAQAAALGLTSLGALPVAQLIAERHRDAGWRRIIMVASLALAGLSVLMVAALPVPGDGWYLAARAERYLVMGLIALVPGLIVAFSRAPGAGAGIADRLDSLALGATPGAAMTVLPPVFGPVPLVAWIVVLIAWRRLTIAPLLGLAQRTQRQRDLAVVAVEAERARLAADLHDDALQELTALVRRLDGAGDAEGAELARGVAERLRAITSDLRLPLLDDLGAGPALEWLVGRFRPLADGEVRLERVDPQRPPAGVELAVFRVAQEALANAIKHGRPPITVRYRVDETGSVSLSVDDEGPGIDPRAAEEALHAGHLGVANMQQRAQQIGALLDIRRWPGGGTHVALEWRPQ
ncbi:MAG: sensor histidine kinase, partial [Candidatus Limnocylindria bacterium]